MKAWRPPRRVLRPAQSILALGAMVVLVAMVAWAVRAPDYRVPAAVPTSPWGLLAGLVQEAALSLLLIGALALVVGLVWMVLSARDRSQSDAVPKSNFWASLAVGFLLLLALFLRGVAGGRRHPVQLHLQGTAGAPHSAAATTVATPGAEWLLFLLPVVLLSFLLLRRLVAPPRREERWVKPEPEDDGSAPLSAVEESLESLRREPDPRRAVIRAYAALEHAFAREGLPRVPPETTFEYLQRVFGRFAGTREAALQLARLFEWARFSPHEVDGGMKAEAIAALESVRQRLVLSAPVPRP